MHKNLFGARNPNIILEVKSYGCGFNKYNSNSYINTSIHSTNNFKINTINLKLNNTVFSSMYSTLKLKAVFFVNITRNCQSIIIF